MKTVTQADRPRKNARKADDRRELTTEQRAVLPVVYAWLWAKQRDAGRGFNTYAFARELLQPLPQKQAPPEYQRFATDINLRPWTDRERALLMVIIDSLDRRTLMLVRSIHDLATQVGWNRRRVDRALKDIRTSAWPVVQVDNTYGVIDHQRRMGPLKFSLVGNPQRQTAAGDAARAVSQAERRNAVQADWVQLQIDEYFNRIEPAAATRKQRDLDRFVKFGVRRRAK